MIDKAGIAAEARREMDARLERIATVVLSGLLASPRETRLEGKVVLTPADYAAVACGMAAALIAEIDGR